MTRFGKAYAEAALPKFACYQHRLAGKEVVTEDDRLAISSPNLIQFLGAPLERSFEIEFREM